MQELPRREHCFFFVVGQGAELRPVDFTRARASKSSKVTILPRRDADGQVPSANNNNIYIYIYIYIEYIIIQQ